MKIKIIMYINAISAEMNSINLYIDLLKSNIISYAYGEFIYGTIEDSEKVITLNEDLCDK